MLLTTSLLTSLEELLTGGGIKSLQFSQGTEVRVISTLGREGGKDRSNSLEEGPPQVSVVHNLRKQQKKLELCVQVQS